MGGSGSGLGNYLDGGAGNVEDVLLRIRHGAFESSINFLLQQGGLSVDLTGGETSDPRLADIERALRSGIGDLTLQPLGRPADNMGNIDVLVVITAAHISENPPAEVVNNMVAILRGTILLEDETESVVSESFAVIVRYTDNTGFRLTPVISTDGGFAIPSPDASTWMPVGNR